MIKEDKKAKNKIIKSSSGGNAVYCLGMIGALVYYIQQANNFGDGIIGILKALVWPAILIHKVLTMLHL